VIDTKAPNTIVEVSSFGRVVFKCTDAEKLPAIGGSYNAISANGDEYYSKLEHQRGGLGIHGWIISKKSYKETIGSRDEIKIIYGDIKFDDSTISGICQRFIGNGTMIDSRPFRGKFGENIQFYFEDGSVINCAELVDFILVKPLFSRGK
jgi:hypothetical protein